MKAMTEGDRVTVGFLAGVGMAGATLGRGPDLVSHSRGGLLPLSLISSLWALLCPCLAEI